MGRNKTSYRFPFASYPAVRIALLLSSGIAVSARFDIGLSTAVFLWLSLFSFWLLSEKIIIKVSVELSARLAILSYLLLVFATGFSLQSISNISGKRAIETERVLSLFTGEDIVVRGKILELNKNSSGREILLLEAMDTEFINGQLWHHKYQIRGYADKETKGSIQGEAEIQIRLYSFPEIRNPHEFDYGSWLRGRQIAAHGEVVSFNMISEPGNKGWSSIRKRVQQNIEEQFREEYAPMAKALFLGFKEELDPELKKRFSRSGLSHIMAVSGLHVGFVVAPFWILIPFLWGNKSGKIFGIVILTVMLSGYAGLTGFSASVCRASLMAWLLTYARLFHKLSNSINLTAVAAIVLLLIEPGQLFELGFQLSFSAVFIILLVMPVVQRLIPAGYRHGKAGPLISIVIISIIVQLGLFPLLVNTFGEFSIAGPVANALVLPVLSITVPAGLVISISGVFVSGILIYPVWVVEYLLGWIEWVANTIGYMELSYIESTLQSGVLFIIWICAILLISSCRIPELRWKLMILLLLCCNLFLIDLIQKVPRYKHLEITFMDVGQADAAHIITPGGKHILVDAGRWSPFSNSGDRVLLPYFRNAGIEKLDAVILTHPHSDHIGGISTLIDSLEIGRIYQSDYQYDSALYRTYMMKAEKKKIPILTPLAGTVIDMDPSIRIFTVGPEKKSVKSSNANNHSLAIKLVYGRQSILFTGDAEKEQESQLLKRYGDFLDSDIYQAGHHGSNTSSGMPILEQITPEHTVVSLAFHNPFRHPGTDTIHRLHKSGGEISFTSMEGAIRFRTDGLSSEKVHWKEISY
jgi:competence protein ComEC